MIAILKTISRRWDKSDATIQIESEQQWLKSCIMKSRNETKIQIFPCTNEKAKITVLATGLILLIMVAVILGLFIGLLDPVPIDTKQTVKTLSKACQGDCIICIKRGTESEL